MTLYLKHRPQTISELDLKEVRETLANIVDTKKIPHAFLFAGPRGTGKTSAARILAKVVNCTRKSGKQRAICNKCDQCATITKGSNIDVIELDAASHRGIDDVRALREAVKLSPAKATKKIYIIDEAHMLTTEAANALLKTLEEPPGHVLFILATTNPEKLPETIRSRTSLIRFNNANSEEVSRSLKRLVTREKVKIDGAAINAIAKAADGSFRDAVKTLERLLAEKVKLRKEEIEEYLFKNKSANEEVLLEFLSERKVTEALGEVERVVELGVSMKGYTKALIEALRKSLLAKLGIGEDPYPSISKTDLTKLVELISKASADLPLAVIEQLPLELAIIEWCKNGVTSEAADNGDKNDRIVRKSVSKVKPGKIATSKVKEKLEVVKESMVIDKTRQIGDRFEEISQEIWTKILTLVRPRNASTEALLRATKPVNYDGRTLTLGVFYKFHKERLEEIQHRNLLEEVIASVIGNPIRVVCTLAEPPAKTIKRQPVVVESINVNGGDDVVEPGTVLTDSQDEDIIRVAKEIFGG